MIVLIIVLTIVITIVTTITTAIIIVTIINNRSNHANNKPTASFHNFKSQNFKLSVSNPKTKYVADVSVLSQISNSQGLGRKNNFEIWKTYRRKRRSPPPGRRPLIVIAITNNINTRKS